MISSASIGLLLAMAGVAHAADTRGVGLYRLDPSEITLGSRGHAATPREIPVRGPFRLVGADHGIRSYEAPLPIRPRALFYEHAPEGMELRRASTVFKYAYGPDSSDRPGTWSFTDSSVIVRVRAEVERPKDGTFTLVYPAAQEREDDLWAAADTANDHDFVFRTAQVDDVTRAGVYLPAPASVTWNVNVPAGGALDLQPGILPPEVDDGTRSDGADLEVRVDGEVVRRVRVAERKFDGVRVDLAKWAGKTVHLTLATSDADTTRDHVFVGAPSVVVPTSAPRRVVLVFVDTLRRDHLGIYGATRGASPNIDAWAKGGVVFDDTRSVAPWTLPSARSALSGVQPEFWQDATTLPERLGALGWATAAYVGNVYLSSNFDMADGWGEHGCVNWPYGEYEVRRGIRFLADHPDRDALLMVHFMDMHLPYKEPRAYRGLYAGDAPAGLPESFTRTPLLAAAKKDKDAVRTYLLGRYDQNLRYVDDEVAKLLAAAGPDALVVFFADHGEEFFDHGDLEHGHTLYDELLRVPFVVRGKDLPPHRVTAPTSLLDLTPTLLDLLGMPDPTLAGVSLAGLIHGGDGKEFADRAIAFGRPLYGDNAWGSVRGNDKYTSRAGVERVFDLGADPGEKNDLRGTSGTPTAGREALAQGLDRKVGLVYRLKPRGNGTISVVMHVPGGATAWVGDDPTNMTQATVEMIDAETVRATFRPSRGVSREIFVAPAQDAEAIAGTVTVDVPHGGQTLDATHGILGATTLTARPYDGIAEPLATVKSGRQTLEITYAAMPLPAGQAASGYDPELQGALEKMGYLHHDEEPADPEE